MGPFSACQSLRPSKSNALITVLSPISPATKIRFSAIDTVPNPCPIPALRHSSRGPSAGHCRKRPVSNDRLSRRGPWNCGHAHALGGSSAATTAPSTPTINTVIHVKVVRAATVTIVFIAPSASGIVMTCYQITASTHRQEQPAADGWTG